MKAQPNHRIYIAVLRQMGPEERLKKAFQLSEFCRALFRRGLELRHADLDASELERLYQSGMEKARARSD